MGDGRGRSPRSRSELRAAAERPRTGEAPRRTKYLTNRHIVTAVKRLYLYQGSLAVWGASFLLVAGASFAAGDGGLVPALFALSGSALVLGSGYELLRTDPADFSASGGSLLLVVGSAVAIAALTVLDVVVSP